MHNTQRTTPEGLLKLLRRVRPFVRAAVAPVTPEEVEQGLVEDFYNDMADRLLFEVDAAIKELEVLHGNRDLDS